MDIQALLITISFINFKGGITKTSTTVGLGAALARRGFRVLLIDCDPQGHLSVHLGVNRDDLEEGIENVLGERGRSLKNVIVEAEENLWLVPARRDLFDARTRLMNRRGPDGLLARAMKGLQRDYDFVLIDSPPDEGILSINAMYASRWIVVPTELKAGSIDGINRVIDNVEDLKEAHDRDWEILGVLINKYNEIEKVENRANEAPLKEAFEEDGLLFKTRIRTDQEFPRAWRYGKSIFARSPRSKGAQDFELLAKELLEKLSHKQVKLPTPQKAVTHA